MEVEVEVRFGRRDGEGRRRGGDAVETIGAREVEREEKVGRFDRWV